MINSLLKNVRTNLEEQIIKKIMLKYNEELWEEYEQVREEDPIWGEIWQIEGADGTGKSTFAREIAGRSGRVYVHYPIKKEVILKYQRGEISEFEKDLYCVFEIALRRHIAFVRGEEIIEDRGLLSTYIYTKLPTSMRIANEVIKKLEWNTKLAVLTYRYDKEVEDKNDTIEEYERVNKKYIYEFYNVNRYYKSAKLFLSKTNTEELWNFFTLE